MPGHATRNSLEAEVLVIGAGITGLAVALELARGSRRVAVLEAGRASAGLDVGHVRVGLGLSYREAVRRLGRGSAREVWERQRENRERLAALLRTLPSSCSYRQAGGFRLAETRGEALELAESEDLLRDDGFSGEFFDHYMLEARFDVEGFAGGYWAADDAELDAAALVRALAAAAQQAGAELHEQVQVSELQLTGAGVVALGDGRRAHAQHLVLASGAGSGHLVPELSGRLRILEERQLGLEMSLGAALPSPGSAREGTLAWRSAGEELLVRGERPENWAPGRLRCAPRPAGASLRADSAATADGLGLVGRLSGRAALLCCGFGGAALGIAFEAAHWIAEAVSGRDVVPAPWRVERGPAAAS